MVIEYMQIKVLIQQYLLQAQQMEMYILFEKKMHQAQQEQSHGLIVSIGRVEVLLA